MKKRVIIFLMTLAICLSITAPAYAAGQNIRLVDNAELLDITELPDILNELNVVSQKHQVDLVIVTRESIGSKTPERYAESFFTNNGYGYGSNRDGILLLISMENRDWQVYTNGYGQTAITDDALERISDEIESDLSKGNYATAFHTYIQLCDEMITSALDGQPYKAPFHLLPALLISVIIGFVIALIVTGIMRGQLKSVRNKSGATDYVKAGSLNVSEARDMFLYRSITRRPRPQNDSSGTRRSSSGHGGGGKF